MNAEKVRPEVIQELYDVLRATRTLRKKGYTMAVAGELGLADLYAMHGSQSLVRWIEIVTNNALHNAELDGITPVEVVNSVN